MSQKHTNIHKDSVHPTLTALRQLAIKYSGRPDDADELVQDLLLKTVRRQQLG